MKTKFESNVASDIPKTKVNEPKLPWKMKTADIEKLEDTGVKTGVVFPLRTRAVFLSMLVTVVFATAAYFTYYLLGENQHMVSKIFEKERKVLRLQNDLIKTEEEKKSLDKNAAKLEDRVSELNAQKDLFTAVIESLTKNDESKIDE